MIEPSNITKYDRTRGELEEFMLFCVLCAGKSSAVQAVKLEEFLCGCQNGLAGGFCMYPFEMIRHMEKDGILLDRMKKAKLGKYKLMMASFLALVNGYGLLRHRNLDHLRKKLASLPGVGLKTASLYILHSFEGCKMAVLDTHLLRFLRKEYPKARIPKASPQDADRYKQVEDLWLGYCYRNGHNPATHDLEIWNNK
jgi:thermostable 8-oxoguanine DNA glycosylase